MKPRTFLHTLQSPLARRIILAMVLFSAVVALVTTAAQLYKEYRTDKLNLEKQLEQIGAVQLPSLTQSLWVANNKEIRLQLEGILRMPNVVYASVEGVGSSMTAAGNPNAEHRIERLYPMRYTQQEKTRDIGTLRVVATLEHIERQILSHAIELLWVNTLQIILVVLFIFAVFYRLVTRHLTFVADHLRTADPAVAETELALAREPTSRPDELDVLVSSVNDMQRKTRQALDELRESRSQVRLLLDSTSEAIYGMDTEGICTFVNPAAIRMLGYASEADLVGKHMHELIQHTHADGSPYPVGESSIHQATREGRSCHCKEEIHWRADGSYFPVEYWSRPMHSNGELVGTVVAFNDITQSKQAEEELHRLAYFDSLTGLPNRQLFHDRLQHALTDARRRGRMVALMLLDLDRFKIVNDTMGHDAGDVLLREISRRLAAGVRSNDTVSRLGGDEFALIFTDVAEPRFIARIAQKVLSRFEAPIMIDGREVFSGASIGVAMYPTDTEDKEALLKFADSAMYHAKELGRNNCQFYSNDMTVSVQARLQMETRLRRALEKNELVLHYQPLVDARHERPTGVEALLRWRDGNGQLISPAEFIPLAEDTGLIIPIGQWVLETACAQLSAWHKAGNESLTMSVNVASRQFRDPDFLDTVRHALAASGIPPQSLELEITESILLENSEHTLSTLQGLKTLGVTLALDDFGTGYSSLNYLKRFPIDRVKIDQSFVRDLDSDNEDLAIIRAIIALARAMQLSVIAEGVETEHQLTLLKDEDCHDYQGYFYARPMEATEVFSRFLSDPDLRARAGHQHATS